MRRAIVLALALLSISLTGGTCEFRATSGNPPPPPATPQPRADASSTTGSGLAVVARTATSTADASLESLPRATIQTILSTSVLDSAISASPIGEISRAPDASTPAQPVLAAAEVFTLRSRAVSESGPAGAVPEPAAFGLFGVGLAALAIRLLVKRSRAEC